MHLHITATRTLICISVQKHGLNVQRWKAACCDRPPGGGGISIAISGPCPHYCAISSDQRTASTGTALLLRVGEAERAPTCELRHNYAAGSL